MTMRVTFDRSANAAYIFLREIGPGEAASQYLCEARQAKGMIVLDFDAKGRLIGIEILNATRALPAELLERAE